MIDFENEILPQCFDCGEEFSPKRKALGYEHCLECGEGYAKKETIRKSKCVAPAFNKGAYMYVSSKSMAKDLGR